MLEEKGAAKGFLLGILAGGITGGLIALLYAPKSGRELRQDIGRKKDELIDDAEEYLDIAKNKASDIIASGRAYF
jgi:gas vesicle protein